MIAQLPMKPEWQNQATNYQLVFARFCACNFGVDYASIDMAEGKAAALIGSMRQCQREAFVRRPPSSPLIRPQLAEPVIRLFQPHLLWRAIHPNISMF
jgi:hypothetical protein